MRRVRETQYKTVNETRPQFINRPSSVCVWCSLGMNFHACNFPAKSDKSRLQLMTAYSSRRRKVDRRPAYRVRTYRSRSFSYLVDEPGRHSRRPCSEVALTERSVARAAARCGHDCRRTRRIYGRQLGEGGTRTRTVGYSGK